MRSDINTLNLSKEEKEFIIDYFKYVRTKINYPTHPEILIGSARYPIGRLILRNRLTEKFIKIRNKSFEDKDSPVFDSFKKSIKHLEQVLQIFNEVKEKGKTVKKYKRK